MNSTVFHLPREHIREDNKTGCVGINHSGKKFIFSPGSFAINSRIRHPHTLTNGTRTKERISTHTHTDTEVYISITMLI